MRSGDLSAAPFNDVQNLQMTGSGTGTITFDVAPAGATGAIRRTLRARRVVWAAVPQTANVYDYVQEVFRFFVGRQREATLRQALLRRATENMVTCVFCGGLVDVRSVDAEAPKCPRCGAPLLNPAEVV